jgi:hypothetical protein
MGLRGCEAPRRPPSRNSFDKNLKLAMLWHTSMENNGALDITTIATPAFTVGQRLGQAERPATGPGGRTS